jgi:hypothetical protein
LIYFQFDLQNAQQVVISKSLCQRKASGLLVMQPLHDEPDLRLKPYQVWSKRLSISHLLSLFSFNTLEICWPAGLLADFQFNI